MSNMSYCRFQNTAADLLDCVEHLHSLPPRDYDPHGTGGPGINTEQEIETRGRIVRYAAQILEDLGVELDMNEVEKKISELEYDEYWTGDDEE